jgi:hypothetical protein
MSVLVFTKATIQRLYPDIWDALLFLDQIKPIEQLVPVS